MFEKEEVPSELFAEISDHGEGWRKTHLDLSATLLFLSRIKRALSAMEETVAGRDEWNALKTRGQAYARRRALYVAAEAVGRLRRGAQLVERETITKELGVVVEEGTTLQKVHALRALSFIPSVECIPILKRGLQERRSPWVQATALHILLNTDLRQVAPKEVLTEFLHDTFRRQTRREAVLDPEAVVNNFYVNKGLFVGLLKVPGARRFALLSLRLWLKSAVLTALIPLWVAAAFVFGALETAAGTVFVKLPRKIISTPDLGRKTLRAAYTLFVKLPYQVLIRLPFKILTTPLWARKVKISFASLREGYVYLSLLDYAFVYLLVLAGVPHGALRLSIGLGVYWLLLASSSGFEARRSGERFRLFFRCVCAALLAWYTRSSGQDARLTAAFYWAAAAQAVWFLPAFVRALATVTLVLFRVLQDAVKGLRDVAASEVKDAFEGEWEETPPPERFLKGSATLIDRSLRTLARNLWQVLRPRLRKIFVVVSAVVLAAAVVYYAMRSFLLRFPDDSELMGLEVGAWLVSLKPYLYFAIGGLIVAIPCAIFLSIFHALWDELWLVETIYFRLRSRNSERFKSLKSINEFLGYIISIVRDRTKPKGFRVRAALALSQVPLATQEHIDWLTDLADENLPDSVRDVVSQAVDAAEVRGKRGQSEKFKIDMELVNLQVEGMWSPGEVLRHWIRRALGGLLLFVIIPGAAWLYVSGGDSLTDTASSVCMALGCVLVLLYMCFARRKNKAVKWCLMAGLILLASVFTRPLQLPLYEAAWRNYFANGAVGLVELSTLSALIVPAVVAVVVAQLGHTVYLLGSDADVNLGLKGSANIVNRRRKRWKMQEFVVWPTLFLALCATLAQSRPFQEYLDLRDAKTPSFATNGKESEVELRGVPTDGRVVRVAMVRANWLDESARPEGDKQTSPDEALAAVTRSLRDAGLFPVEASDVFSDVWLSMKDGKIYAWQTSPVRCLEPSGTVGDAVVFNLDSLCTFKSKRKLVVVVYDKKRSDFIMNMRTPEDEQQTAQSGDAIPVYPSDKLLLVDAASPFVKVVWSPVF